MEMFQYFEKIVILKHKTLLYARYINHVKKQTDGPKLENICKYENFIWRLIFSNDHL